MRKDLIGYLARTLRKIKVRAKETNSIKGCKAEVDC